MKKVAQIAKVIILTFCLMIFSLNFHQVLNAIECLEEAAHPCMADAEYWCANACTGEYEEDCSFYNFLYGMCDGGLCYQWYDFYCETGWVRNFGPISCASSGCPL